MKESVEKKPEMLDNKAEMKRSFALEAPRPADPPSTSKRPLNLPVFAKKDEILAAIRANFVTIVVGETGSGKKTAFDFDAVFDDPRLVYIDIMTTSY